MGIEYIPLKKKSMALLNQTKGVSMSNRNVMHRYSGQGGKLMAFRNASEIMADPGRTVTQVHHGVYLNMLFGGCRWGTAPAYGRGSGDPAQWKGADLIPLVLGRIAAADRPRLLCLHRP